MIIMVIKMDVSTSAKNSVVYTSNNNYDAYIKSVIDLPFCILFS